MPPARRPSTRKLKYHQKSKNGCLPCKRKRIKCDEKRPICSYCQHSSSNCTYVALDTSIDSPPCQLKTSHLVISPHDQSTSPSISSPDLVQHGQLTTHKPSGGSFELLHMELLYHWCTTTSHTLTRSPELKTLWKIGVTEIALKNDFVLHAVMALTARHLSRLRPNKHSYYDEIATNFQIKALQGAKEAQVLPDVSETNCTSLFVFSALIWMNTIAIKRKPSDELHIRSSAGWITLLRGITLIALSGKPWLLSRDAAPFLRFGFLGPKLKTKRREENIDNPSEPTRRLKNLQTLISVLDDERRVLIYTKAITDLQDCFSNYHSLPKEACGLSVIFQWPATLSEDYIKLLMDTDPESLVIFAHYVVLMSKILPCWWLEGRGEWIIASIHSHLKHYHRTWIQWPIEELGWTSE